MMKKTLPYLSSALLLCGFLQTGYAYDIITVSTFEDENGTNLNACSVREAVETNNRHVSYGGCKSQTGKYQAVQILLPTGTYNLTAGEITVKKDLELFGTDPSIADEKDSITQEKPKRMPASTIINAGGKSRIFNSSADFASIALTDIKLTNGSATRGGAILAGGVLGLTRTILSQNQASDAGGAIFLEGGETKLTMTASTIENSTAVKGDAIAMTCFNNFVADARSVSIIQSSLINNGNSTTSANTIYGCGSLVLAISQSTIAKNKTNNGDIIKFTDQIGKSASIAFNYGTLVENTAAQVLNYGNITSLTMTNSILAFNSGNGCYSSSHSSTIISSSTNVIQNCAELSTSSTTLPATASLTDQFEYTTDTNGNINALANYGGFTQVYLPKLTSLLIDKVSSDSANNVQNCLADDDQRGVTRQGNFSCDIGAVERMQLIAIDDDQTNNESKTNRIAEKNVLTNDIPNETASTRGQIEDGSYKIVLDSGHDLRCALGQADSQGIISTIVVDTKGGLTGSTPIYCNYHLVKDAITSNSAKAIFVIENKAPVANNDTFSLPYGAASITFNVLSNDNDDGDGIYGGLYNIGSPPLNIVVISDPQIGTIHGEVEGICPAISNNTKNRCLGGKITYKPNNTMSPFGDTFIYEVIDKDGTVSGEATVTINNTAPDSNKDGSGGSIGFLSLFALLGLLLTRRQFTH